MRSPLRILHLEDDASDVALVQSVLEDEGICFDITEVAGHRDFVDALEGGSVDMVFADISLPEFDGMTALAIVRERWPEIPFIILSGTMGEEVAIDALKSGATDYVLKGRLSRLAPAVRRAIAEVKAREENQKLEAQFVEAQKMEVIGQLAGGVAHDFNNILGVIMGYGDLMTQKLEPGDPLREYTEEIRLAAGRAAGLTRQLLVFSRKQKIQPVVLDFGEVLFDLEKMLGRLIDENVELTVAHDESTGRILADPGYVGQVLMNLVVNARDAMPHGGQLRITTGNVTLGEADFQDGEDAEPGDYVVLSVADTGTGMTDEIKAHLFEAFFTTKEAGKGTGLGLVTCQTIARQCGGFIRVTSEPGKGTTFRVYFPRVRQEAAPAAEASWEGPVPSGTETVLVVEDEPAVRHLASSVLESQGYDVLRANNGQDGLRVASAHRGTPIQLVITDVIMPQMGGKVMADWLTASFPGLKILYTSGYTDDAIADHGVLDPGVAFLPKPYSPTTLLRKVRHVLDSGTPAEMAGTYK